MMKNQNPNLSGMSNPADAAARAHKYACDAPEPVQAPARAPLTSDWYKAELAQALKQFGTYSYDDKGPDEVMDTRCKDFMALTPEVAAEILNDLVLVDRGDRLVTALFEGTQEAPDDWFSGVDVRLTPAAHAAFA